MATAKEKVAEVPSVLTLMGALPDAVVGFDHDFQVYFSNNAARNFFCLNEKQLQGVSMAALLGEKQAVFEAMETAVRKNQTATLYDVSIRDKVITSVVIVTVEPDAWYMMVIRQQ